MNRRTQAHFADGNRSEFVYDAVGRLTRTGDTVSGAIDLTYDGLDRLVQEITSQGTVAYQYDLLGRRTSMSANGQTPVGYQYDPASRLTQVAQGDQIVGLGYDAAGWYLPKGTDFNTITTEQIAQIESSLNNRPRKYLGFKTPLEAASQFVALQG